MTNQHHFHEIPNRQSKILFRSAFISYILPFLSLACYSYERHVNQTDSLIFWDVFLLSMFPLGLLGLLFSILGIVKARHTKNIHQNIKGYSLLTMGIIVISIGIIAWIYIYLDAYNITT